MRCQQQELYAAQRRCPEGRHFVDVQEVQDYLDRLFLDSTYLAREHPKVPRIEVGRCRSGAVGGYDQDRGVGRADFALPATQRTALHETAHALAEAKYGSRSHDPYFCRTYLELVFDAMGSEAYTALREGMVEQGVVHEPKVALQ